MRPTAEREAAGHLLMTHGLGLAGDARVVVAHAAVGSEPPTRPLLEALLARGVRVLLPVVTAEPTLGWGELVDWSQLATSALGLLEPIASAEAVPPVRAGLLQCQGGQNVGFVVGSVTSLECVFQSEGRRSEPYIATVRRIGVDLGFTEQTKFTWAVNAPNSRLGIGDLAGSYGGVGANASVGFGGGGNFLVGGPANAYALQPISLQGQTGLNVAAGIAGLELQPVDFGPRRHHHRRHHRRG
jgi:hypothetical protein